MKPVIWFKDLGKSDINIAGGKGANLGELTNAQVPVPDGFVVSANAYKRFLKRHDLGKLITHTLAGLDPEDSKTLMASAKKIKQAMLKADVPPTIAKAISVAYKKLGKDELVAVRSSATAEDLPEASFAGQQATFLNVKGSEMVIGAVRKAWSSLFEPRSIYYRTIHNFDHLKVAIAIPVQKMVESVASGIMFSVNPVSNNEDQVLIEAGLGLGEAIVSGSVTPDQFSVEKGSLKIIEKHISKQAFQIKLKSGKNAHLKLSAKQQAKQKISDDHILELARFARSIEEHYKKPQDIEWAIDKKGQVWIVQSRPITTLKNPSSVENTQANSGGNKRESKNPTITESANATGKGPEKGDYKVLLTGVASSVGLASGPVQIIHKPEEIGKVKTGDVLVAEMTNPAYVPAMQKAVAIVTDAGGATSHAAIVSRELGKPAVVGTGQATHRLKNGQVVSVDGASGKVYSGKVQKAKTDRQVEFAPERGGMPKPHAPVQAEEAPVTATKIYVNLAEVSEAERVAKMAVDGVGLLRAEFMVAQTGKHPKALVATGKSKQYVKALTDGIGTIAKAFSPRPVVYRATDFKTNEYRGLDGGRKYEPEEENPMLGYRGAMRYIKEPEMFGLEMQALREVRESGLKNVHLMIPFVRSVDEFLQVKELVKKFGLIQSRDFKLWIMVEVPSTVLLIDKFCQAGIDGVSIGSNDLTQLTLGVDRDNSKLAKMGAFDERDEAIKLSLERVIRITRAHGVTSSICGNAVSVYPEVAETVVRAGITSVSLQPDASEEVRRLVASIERHMLLEHNWHHG